MGEGMKTVSVMEDNAVLERSQLGFWLYLMTDCILFASLFATFVVLRNATAGGPAGVDIFELPLVLTETILLLISSFTCGIALIGLKLCSMKMVIIALLSTFVLGATFLSIELYEFMTLVAEGYGWQTSAFLSAFFVLVGTHGVHILVGLLWLVVLLYVVVRRGFTPKTVRQILLFSLFWHFLDLIWIFVFTVVYLMGAIV